MLKFKSDHVIYDEEHRPHTFCRLEKTRLSTTDPIPVIRKRKGTRDVEGEPSSKRTKSNPVRKPVQTKRQPKANRSLPRDHHVQKILCSLPFSCSA